MRALIVDDEGNIRRMIRAVLESEGWTVAEAGSAEEALADLDATRPEVVLLDLMLPGMDGAEALPHFGDAVPGVPVVMMSGQATLSDAVRATRNGAFHFLEKPLSADTLLVTLAAALEVSRARELTRSLTESLAPGVRLVGHSDAIEAVRALVRRVAPAEARVLITGESGTGKELVAAAIHTLSHRKGGPFVQVNSAAIPRNLVESEMFGHEKGAFTGATERRRGRFELAHGGTLFLDEVGDLDLEAQAKPLRALETGVVERVGGSDPIEVDVRVIAATNRDLHESVTDGSFREDLLFRLDVVPIHVPPLRERRDDVKPLLRHAADRLRSGQGLIVPDFAPGAIALLEAYGWPGNVRELLNLVERLAILAPGPVIEADDVSVVLSGARGARTAVQPSFDPADRRDLRTRLDDYERALIEGALEACADNVAEAGRRLSTDRANLYRRMKRLGLRDD